MLLLVLLVSVVEHVKKENSLQHKFPGSALWKFVTASGCVERVGGVGGVGGVVVVVVVVVVGGVGGVVVVGDVGRPKCAEISELCSEKSFFASFGKWQSIKFLLFLLNIVKPI